MGAGLAPLHLPARCDAAAAAHPGLSGMAVFDTMRHIRPDVSTVCVGLAASMGAFLLASGHQGKRYSLPNSRIMIHQPLGGAQGQAADIEIQVRGGAAPSVICSITQANEIHGRACPPTTTDMAPSLRPNFRSACPGQRDPAPQAHAQRLPGRVHGAVDGHDHRRHRPRLLHVRAGGGALVGSTNGSDGALSGGGSRAGRRPRINPPFQSCSSLLPSANPHHPCHHRWSTASLTPWSASRR